MTVDPKMKKDVLNNFMCPNYRIHCLRKLLTTYY